MKNFMKYILPGAIQAAIDALPKGTTPNKYTPHQGAQEKARNACGRVIQYVKPVWASCNPTLYREGERWSTYNPGVYAGKGKRTESRRP